MADFDDAEDWRFTEILNEAPYARVALEHQPAIAYHIAVFIGCFAMAELSTWCLLHRITGATQDKCRAMLLPIRTYAAQLDRIAVEWKEHNSAAHEDTEHEALLADLRKLNATRNNYVHAQYGFRPDQEALLRVSWLPSSRATEDAVITLESVQGDVREAKRIVVALFDMHPAG